MLDLGNKNFLPHSYCFTALILMIRESRQEDLDNIARLDTLSRTQAGELRLIEERMAQLRGELLLREENYNKTFSNGGAGEKTLSVDKALNAQQGVVDWMLKGNSRRRVTTDGKPSKSERTPSFKAVNR